MFPRQSLICRWNHGPWFKPFGRVFGPDPWHTRYKQPSSRFHAPRHFGSSTPLVSFRLSGMVLLTGRPTFPFSPGWFVVLSTPTFEIPESEATGACKHGGWLLHSGIIE